MTSAEARVFRLAYLVTHPIQYQAPLLRAIAAMPELDLHVYYQSDHSLRAFEDPGFGQRIEWDVPLLGGYESSFLRPLPFTPARISAVWPFSAGLVRKLVTRRHDGVWLHGYARPYNLLIALIARCLGLVVMMRDDVQLRGSRRRPSIEFVKKLMVTALDRVGVRFLAVGSLNRDYYRSLGARAESIVMMPYAIDNAFFRKQMAAAQDRQPRLKDELGLEDGAAVILFAAKFQPRKRAGDLVEAYVRVRSEVMRAGRPEPYLLLAGSGETQAQVQAAAQEQGLERVIFLGFQSQKQLAALFDLCTVFVAPAAAEPWGLVINEVMNAAKPVIVTDETGCWPDLVRDGENGFVVPVGDIDTLASRLQSIVLDAELAATMGRKSLEIIDRWDFAADVRALREALGRWTPSRRAARAAEIESVAR